MSHGGTRPGAGRPKGAKNKVTVAREAAIAESGMTPLDFMLAVLRDEDADDKDRMWAAVAAAPYVHPKPRPKAHDADAGRIQVNVVRFTHEQSLAELEEIDARARRLEAERLETDSHRALREPPQPPQTSPQPPAPALRPNGVPHEPRPLDRANGNGASHPEGANGASRPSPRGTDADGGPGHPRPLNIRARPREIRDYPPTHPVHGIV